MDSHMANTKLVLSRRRGQSFQLATSDGIVTITRFSNHKFAIDAPRTIEIHRLELLDPVGEIQRLEQNEALHAENLR